MPQGVQQVPMTVSVNVPGDAKLGSYTGNIQVVVSPLVGPASGTVGITIGAQIDVDLQVVSDKVVKFKLDHVIMSNAEEGSSLWWMHFPGKVTFAMDMENLGNIPGSPDKVVFQYQNYLNGQVLETENNSNWLPSIQPFDRKQIVAQMPVYLPQGSYRVNYQVFGKDDGDVLGQGTLDLSVLPHGTLAGYVGYNFWGLRWPEKLITFGVIAGILVILWGIYTFIRYFRRRGRPRKGKGHDRVFAPPPTPYD